MDKEQLRTALFFQWERPTRPLINRHYDFPLNIEQEEILILTGVRRCGKSSLLKLIAKEIEDSCESIIVEFDDPNLGSFEGENFQDIVEIWREKFGESSKKKVLFFDEIQLVEKWEIWILNLAKDPQYKIFISGSNAKMLSSELSTLLTGRHRSYEITPFHFKEISDLNLSEISEDLPNLYENYFKFGGFPRSYLEQDQSILNEYLNDIIERDIIARYGARLKRPLKELARFLCTNNTRLINRNKLASDLGVKDEGTIKRYCGWLEDVYLFQELKIFSFSSRKIARSSPKYYSVDPTFARVNGFSFERNEGAFLENMVHNDLRKAGYEMGYYQSNGTNKCEVDFVARKGGRNPMAIQVSLSIQDEKTLERELQGLIAVAEEFRIKDLFLITKSDVEREIRKGDRRIEVCSYLGNYRDRIF